MLFDNFMILMTIVLTTSVRIPNQLFSVIITWDIKNYRMDGVAGKVVLK